MLAGERVDAEVPRVRPVGVQLDFSQEAVGAEAAVEAADVEEVVVVEDLEPSTDAYSKISECGLVAWIMLISCSTSVRLLCMASRNLKVVPTISILDHSLPSGSPFHLSTRFCSQLSISFAINFCMQYNFSRPFD